MVKFVNWIFSEQYNICCAHCTAHSWGSLECWVHIVYTPRCVKASVWCFHNNGSGAALSSGILGLSLYYTLYTLHSPIYNLHLAIFALLSSLCNHHSTVYNLHPTLYTLLFTPYNIHHFSSLWNHHSTLYSLHPTIFTIISTHCKHHSRLYTLHSTLYSLDYIFEYITS